jgi:imidazolonepropionase-like amidohydrolase
MPGSIDAHVHSSTLNITRVVQTPVSYLAHFAADFMRASLDRGFTMLRDVSGGEVGLAHAIRDGLLKAVPRIFCGERLISQTGGHGDQIEVRVPAQRGCDVIARRVEQRNTITARH